MYHLQCSPPRVGEGQGAFKGRFGEDEARHSISGMIVVSKHTKSEDPVSHQHALSQWQTTVSTHLPNLSPAQATVLAFWSFGMLLARSCGITSVCAILAPLLGSSESTLRQRLREWCYDKDDKRGKKRQDIDVSSCFPFLLR